MHPNSQLEEYLKLVKRLEYKINLIRDIVGQDQRILNSNEILNPIEFKDDIEVDKIQQLYSSNANERNQIFTQLENDEYYLTDDKFITDLRYFDAKYEDNLEYKKQIYNIPKGKFGLLAGKDKSLLIFTQMNHNAGNKLFNKFFKVVKDKKEGIDDLVALQLIQADESNTKRQNSQAYKLYMQYFNKKYIQEFIVSVQTIRDGTRELNTGMQNLRIKFLKLLLELQYEEKYIDIFENALLYSNHSDFKQIETMLKNRSKSPNPNNCRPLLIFCEQAIQNLDKNESNKQATICEGVLYYGTN